MQKGDKVFYLSAPYLSLKEELTVARVTNDYFWCEERNNRHLKSKYVVGYIPYLRGIIKLRRDRIEVYKGRINAEQKEIATARAELANRLREKK